MGTTRFSEQLSRELAEAGPPPLGSIAADALRAGVRARRRRRFGIAGSGAGVLAILVAGAVALAPFGAGFGGQQPGALPTAPQKPTTGQAVIVLLTDLVPEGGTLSEVEGYTAGGAAGGGFLYDDGHGAATVSAGVNGAPIDYGMGPGLQCPPSADGFVCELRTTPEGFTARVATMGPYLTGCDEPKCGIKDVRVEVARPNGLYVVIESYNGPFGHGRPATRADTVLTADQMITMASDPRWGLTMDAAFVDGAQTKVDPSKVHTQADTPPSTPVKK